MSNIFQTQTISKAALGAASGCPGGARVGSPWPPWTPWLSAKAIRGPKNSRPKFVRSLHVLRKNSVSNTCQPQTASKAAPGCPWGTKVRPWSPWTSGPSIRAIKGPKHSRPKFVRSPQLMRKKSRVKTFFQPQTTLTTASKAASGCPGGIKVRPWPPWKSWPSFKALRDQKTQHQLCDQLPSSYLAQSVASPSTEKTGSADHGSRMGPCRPWLYTYLYMSNPIPKPFRHANFSRRTLPTLPVQAFLEEQFGSSYRGGKHA